MSRYLVVIEVKGQTGGTDEERERSAFEAALQRGYPKENRIGYTELSVLHFEKLRDGDIHAVLEEIQEEGARGGCGASARERT